MWLEIGLKPVGVLCHYPTPASRPSAIQRRKSVHPMALPSATKYLIVGAGIHGLSTAWHLAESLRRSGRGSGRDILVVDKSGIAAGASGIACGVIRNNYYQPA